MKKDNVKRLVTGNRGLDRKFTRSQVSETLKVLETFKVWRSVLVIFVMGLVFSACSKPYISPDSRVPDWEQEGKIEEPSAEKHEIEAYDIGKTPKKEIPQIGSSETDAKTSQPSYIAGVSRLMDKANRQMTQENFDHAFATAERALRIDPSNARLWSLMAEIQLKRGNANQAEALAKKSNLLAKGDKSLQSKNWRIIAESLYRQGKTDEADQASRKAEEVGSDGSEK